MGCTDSNASEPTPIPEPVINDGGDVSDEEEEGGDPFIPDEPLYDEEQWFRDLCVDHWLSGGA